MPLPSAHHSTVSENTSPMREILLNFYEQFAVVSADRIRMSPSGSVEASALYPSLRTARQRRSGAQPRLSPRLRRFSFPSAGCGVIASRGWTPARGPLLSGLDFVDRAPGLDSTGFRGVRRDRDPDRRPASRPSHRHTRTCSGYPHDRPAEPLERDTRNKSGYDGEACPELVEGRRSAPPDG